MHMRLMACREYRLQAQMLCMYPFISIQVHIYLSEFMYVVGAYDPDVHRLVCFGLVLLPSSPYFEFVLDARWRSLLLWSVW